MKKGLFLSGWILFFLTSLTAFASGGEAYLLKETGKKFGKGLFYSHLSPDGKHFFYFTKVKKEWKGWVDSADKTKQILTLQETFKVESLPSWSPWSPDSGRIVFESPSKKGIFRIYNLKDGKWSLELAFTHQPLWYGNDQLAGLRSGEAALVALKDGKGTPLKITLPATLVASSEKAGKVAFFQGGKVQIYDVKGQKVASSFDLPKGGTLKQIIFGDGGYGCLYNLGDHSEILLGGAKNPLRGEKILRIGSWQKNWIFNGKVWNPATLSYEMWTIVGDEKLKNLYPLTRRGYFKSISDQGDLLIGSVEGYTLAKIEKGKVDLGLDSLVLKHWGDGGFLKTHQGLSQIAQSLYIHLGLHKELPKKKILTKLKKFDEDLPLKDGFGKDYTFKVEGILSSNQEGAQLQLKMDKGKGLICFLWKGKELAQKAVSLSNRTRSTLLITQALYALDQKQYAQAAGLAQESKKNYPKNPAADKILKIIPLVKEAWEALGKRDLKKAEELAKKVLALHKNSKTGAFLLRRAQDLEKYKGLIEEVKKQLTQKAYKNAYATASEASGLDPQNKEALDLMQKIKAIEKEIADHLAKAKKAFDDFELDKTEEHLSKILKLEPQNKTLTELIEKVVTFCYGEAKKNFEKEEKNLPLAKDYLKRGLKLSPKDKNSLDLQKALQAYEAYVQKNKDKVEAEKVFAKAQKLLKEKKEKEALALLKKAAKLDPKNEKIQKAFTTLNAKVEKEETILRNKKVKELFEKATALLKKEDLPGAFEVLEEILALQKDHKEAKEALVKALEKFSEKIEGAITQREYKKASAMAEVLKKRLPKDYAELQAKIKEGQNRDLFEGYMAKGLELEGKGKLKEALGVFKEALALLPKSIEAKKASERTNLKIREMKSLALQKEARSALEKKEYTRAKELALKAKHLFENPQVNQLIEETQRAEEIAGSLAGVEKLLKANKPKGALKELDRLLDKYPGDKVLTTRFQEVRGLIEKEEQKEKARLYLKEAELALNREDCYTARSLSKDVLAINPESKEAKKILEQAQKKIEGLQSAIKVQHLLLQVRISLKKIQEANSSLSVKTLHQDITESLDQVEDLSPSTDTKAWKKKAKEQKEKFFAYWEEVEKGRELQQKNPTEALKSFTKALTFHNGKVAQDLRGETQKVLTQKSNEKKGLELFKKAREIAKKKASEGLKLAGEALKFLPENEELQKLSRELTGKVKFLTLLEKANKAFQEKKYLLSMMALEQASLLNPKGEVEKLTAQIQKALEKEKQFKELQQFIETGVKAIQERKYAESKKKWKLELTVLSKTAKWTSKEEVQGVKKEALALLKEKIKEDALVMVEQAKKLVANQGDGWQKKALELLEKAGKIAETPDAGQLKKNLEELLKLQKAYQEAAQKSDNAGAVEWLGKIKNLLISLGGSADEATQLIQGFSQTVTRNYSREEYEEALKLLGNGKLKKAIDFLREVNQKTKNTHPLLTSLEEELRAVQAMGGLPRGMVYVPSGVFYFGHFKKREILAGYFIDKHEVTNRDFQKYLKDDKVTLSEYFQESSGWKGLNFPPNAGLHPVVGITYSEALAFARSQGKRLATEMEWEKAARGPFDKRLFSWGEEFYVFKANLERGVTVRGGQFAQDRSLYGCLDMIGNASEWVDSVIFQKRALRIQKGGNFLYNSSPPFCTIDYRYWSAKESRSKAVGFRCAMDLDMAKVYLKKEKASRKKDAIEKATAKKATDEAATKKAADEAAAKKKAADEAAAKKAADEAAAKKKASDEAAAKKKASDEAAAKKKASDEAAAKKKAADEAAAKKKAADEAAAKKKAADEAAAKKKAADEEAAKKKAADEAAAKKKAADEAAAKKKAADEAAAKKKAADEAAAKKKAADEAAAKKKAADEAAAKKKAADEAAAKKAADEAAAKKKAADEAAAKKAADEAAAKKAADEAAAKKAADEAAKKKSELEKKRAADEAAKKAADEAARKKAADETTKKKILSESTNLYQKGQGTTALKKLANQKENSFSTLRKNITTVLNFYNMAQKAQREKKYTESIKHFQALLRVEKNKKNFYYIASQKGIQACQQGLQKQKIAEALIPYEAGDGEKALKMLGTLNTKEARLLREKIQKITQWMKQGQTLRDQQKYREAINIFQQVLKLEKKDGNYYRMFAQQLVQECQMMLENQ